jgi:hypothetical protein
VTEDWYSYSEIQFNRQQVTWILENAATLRDGRWPPEPRNSGYTDSPIGKRHIRAEAGFIKPASVFAEVAIRLKRCDRDGGLVLAYYLGLVDIPWLANWERCSEDELWRKINRAITYAGSGACRRWMPCTNCYRRGSCPKVGERQLRVKTYKQWRESYHHRIEVVGMGVYHA